MTFRNTDGMQTFRYKSRALQRDRKIGLRTKWYGVAMVKGNKKFDGIATRQALEGIEV